MKPFISLMLIFLLILSLIGCAAVPGESTETHVITDQDGFEVTLPKEINRIVVCDILPLPSVLAVFFDSAEKIVGISGTSMNAAENSLLGELYPELLEAETGFINGTTVNAEELMNLQPDVVFYNASRKELGETLRKAGFPAESNLPGQRQNQNRGRLLPGDVQSGTGAGQHHSRRSAGTGILPLSVQRYQFTDLRQKILRSVVGRCHWCCQRCGRTGQ